MSTRRLSWAVDEKLSCASRPRTKPESRLQQIQAVAIPPIQPVVADTAAVDQAERNQCQPPVMGGPGCHGKGGRDDGAGEADADGDPVRHRNVALLVARRWSAPRCSCVQCIPGGRKTTAYGRNLDADRRNLDCLLTSVPQSLTSSVPRTGLSH